jgi:hypothetical protein
MQNRIKDYARLKLDSERENVELLRQYLALINFHSREGCTTSSLEYFIDTDLLKFEFGRIEQTTTQSDDNSKSNLAEFRELLHHPVTFEVFKDACVKSFNQEHATFLAEVHYLLKWKKFDSIADRRMRAESIWKTYLREDSPRQVNIPSDLRMEAEKIFNEEKLLNAESNFQEIEKLFRAIETEVHKLLFNSTFRVGQFHGSPEWKWCKVVLKHLPMPAFEVMMKRKDDSSTTEDGSPSSHKQDSVHQVIEANPSSSTVM